MTANEYQELALRSESPSNIPNIRMTDRVIHCAMGINTESGELMDILKKYYFYNQTFDLENFKEELGDLLWYIAIGAQACGTTIELLMEANIEKLKIRYPVKFTEQLAKERLDKKAME